MRLRTYLPLLTVGIYLPILAAIVGASVLNARSQQEAIRQQLFLTARAVAAAADREMEDSIDALQAVARSSDLQSGSVAQIYAMLRRVVAAQTHWRSVLLLDAAGEPIFYSDQPLGAKLPSPADREHIRKAIETGAPAISSTLFMGRLSGSPIVGVAVPVYVAGKMKYILVANFAFTGLQRIFGAIELPRSATAAIIDHSGSIITTNIGSQFVGQPAATPGVAEAARLGVERAMSGMNKAGEPTFAVVSPSKLAHWAVVIGMARDAYDRPLWDTLWTIGGGGLLLVILSGLAAAFGGRTVARGVSGLARAVDRLGRGETLPALPASNLREIRETTASLNRAGELIRQREDERDDALRRLEARVRCQEAIALIGRLGVSETNMDDLLRTVADAVGRALQVEFCEIMELEPDRPQLRLRASRGWGDAVAESARIEADSRSQPGYSLITGAAAIVEDAARETRFEIPALMRDHGIVSGVTVVLRNKSGPFGILGVHSRAARRFSVDDVHFCVAAAYLLSTILIRWENEVAVRRLATENDQFAAAINATNRGIVFTDPARPGNPIVFVNPAFTRITGYSPDEVLGRGYQLLLGAGTDPRATGDLHDALAERRVETITILNYRKDGRPFWNELTVSPLPSRDDLRLFVWIMSDITARRSAEERLHQAQKMDALGQLTGGVAHDFNNLLTIIMGNVEELEERLADDPELRRIASVAAHAAEQGRALTTRLLSFARAQPLRPEPVDLNALVAGMEDMLRRTLGEQITVSLELDPSSPEIVVDRSQLEAAILNLAINSRDSMPRGGIVTVRTKVAERPPPDPATGPVEPAVELSVRDTGIGMPPDILARACEPFFTTKAAGQGTGLGLSSIYGFVHQSAGGMEIRSAPGQGTTVELRFPLASPACDACALSRRSNDPESLLA